MKNKIVLSAVLALAAALPSMAAGADKVCTLVTPAELESIAGSEVTMTANSLGNAQICSGRTPALSVMLRMAQRKPGGGNEAAGAAIAEQMGATVEVKTFGAITCSTMVPPKGKEEYGFNTTCSVLKGTTVAAIEITAKSRKDMVPIDKLRPVAEKIAKRF
jgi:hypothetical protein